jgi:hypothetical protein
MTRVFNFRVSFYVLIYLINAVLVGTHESLICTLPTFAILVYFLFDIRGEKFDFLDMFIFCYFIFFILAPLQSIRSYGFGDGVYFSIGPAEGFLFYLSEMLTATMIVSLFLLFSLLLFRLFDKYRNTPAHSVVINRNVNNDAIIKSNLLLLMSLAFCILFVYFSGGLSNVLASRFDKDDDQISNLTVIFLTALSMCVFSFSSYYFDLSKKNKILCWAQYITCVGLLLLICNPLTTPRFILIGCWLPVFFIIYKKGFDVKKTYAVIFISIIFALPALSLTSRMGVDGFDELGNAFNLERLFISPYADVFDTLVYLVRYVDTFGHTFGSNALGLLTFYIPRELWAGKPELIAISLGEELMYFSNAGTFNLSSFYGGELFMDFHIGGVFLAAMFLALLMVWVKKIDSSFGLTAFQKIPVFIFIGSVPIIIRGPIMAVGTLMLFQIVWFYIFSYVGTFARSRGLR